MTSRLPSCVPGSIMGRHGFTPAQLSSRICPLKAWPHPSPAFSQDLSWEGMTSPLPSCVSGFYFISGLHFWLCERSPLLIIYGNTSQTQPDALYQSSSLMFLSLLKLTANVGHHIASLFLAFLLSVFLLSATPMGSMEEILCLSSDNHLLESALSG